MHAFKRLEDIMFFPAPIIDQRKKKLNIVNSNKYSKQASIFFYQEYKFFMTNSLTNSKHRDKKKK